MGTQPMSGSWPTAKIYDPSTSTCAPYRGGVAYSSSSYLYPPPSSYYYYNNYYNSHYGGYYRPGYNPGYRPSYNPGYRPGYRPGYNNPPSYNNPRCYWYLLNPDAEIKVETTTTTDVATSETLYRTVTTLLPVRADLTNGIFRLPKNTLIDQGYIVSAVFDNPKVVSTGGKWHLGFSQYGDRNNYWQWANDQRGPDHDPERGLNRPAGETPRCDSTSHCYAWSDFSSILVLGNQPAQ